MLFIDAVTVEMSAVVLLVAIVILGRSVRATVVQVRTQSRTTVLAVDLKRKG